MKKYKAIVIDDEKTARENLTILLEALNFPVEIVAEASSVLEGIKEVNRIKPDLVFLDIKMPGLSGFNFLEVFEQKAFHVIVVSAHEEYALQGIESDVDGYLLKPISIDKLSKALVKFMDAQKGQSRKLSFPTQSGITYLDPEDIIRCEASNNYTTIYPIAGKKLVVSRSLKLVEAQINSTSFIRSHQSHLVNMSYIVQFEKVDGGYLVLRSGDKIPVSESRKKDTLSRITNQ